MKTNVTSRMGWVCLLIVFLLTVPVLSEDTPVGEIDTQALSEMLQTYEMAELLDALARVSNDPSLRVNLLLRQAQSQRDPDAADKIYLEALKLIDQNIAAQEKKQKELQPQIATSISKREAWDEAVVKYYKARLQKVKVSVLDRGAQYINRMVFLLGSPADKVALGKLIGDNITQLSVFDRELKNFLLDHTQADDLIYLVPELEMVRGLARFQGAFVRYYDAMSKPMYLPDGKLNHVRAGILDDAIADATKLLRNPDWEENQGIIYLLIGNCQREAGLFDSAEGSLKKAVELGEGSVAVEAAFVMARNLAEWGATLVGKGEQGGDAKFNAALKQVSAYGQAARQAGRDQEYADITSLSLEFYIYDIWAKALRKADKPAEADKIVAAGMEKLTAFIEKYTDNPGVMAFVGQRFRDKFINMPKEKLPAAILLFVGRAELNDARAMVDQQQKKAEDIDVAKKLKSAVSFLEELTKRTAPAEAKLHPDAQYNLGVANLYMGKNFEAIEAFLKVAELNPKHSQARESVDLAIRLSDKLIKDDQEDAAKEGRPVYAERRVQLINSAIIFLKHWPEDKAADEHRYALALNADKLSTYPDEKDKSKWLDLAIENYQKVSPSSPLYSQAIFYGLDLQYRKVTTTPDLKNRSAVARTLENELRKYGSDAHAKWLEASGEEKEELGSYGSLAEFRAAELAYNILGLKPQAITQIRELPKRWPGTAVLQDANSFLIRKLLEDGKISDGIAEYRKFTKDYGKQAAQGLINQVVTTLSETIQALSESGDKPQQLATFRKAYLDFTKQLYDAEAQSDDASRRYEAITMYGDALLQSGTKENVQTALQLFGGLQKKIDDEAAALVAKSNKYLDEKVAQVKRAEGNLAAAKALKSSYDETIKHFFGNKPYKGILPERVKLAFEDAEKGGDSVNRSKAIVSAILKVYDEIRKSAERRKTLDPIVLRGLAIAEMRTGQYESAMKRFKLLTLGLDIRKHPGWYWDAQANYCQCILELCKDKPSDLNSLIDHINELQKNAPELGGERYKRKFNVIRTQAKTLAGKS